MMIQFHNETSGTALGGNEPLSRSHMREGASRNPLFLSRCCSALIDIAAVVAGVLLICATGLGIAFAAFVLIFVSL